MPSQWLTWLKRSVILLGMLSTNAWADYALNMTRGASPISNGIHGLHMTILWVCVVIGTVVYGIMLYAIICHRKARGVTPAAFHESTTVEIIWTIVPFLILLVMAVPATRTLIYMTDTSKADVTIKITGHRWYWQYEYPDENINFFSYMSTPEDELKNRAPKTKHYLLEVDKPLVIPVGKKVRFLVTAKDVIHSWWVPDFGVKRDAIPGFIHESWTYVDPDKPGTYRGQCAELCGTNHGYMPIVVEAKTEAEYHKWLVAQKTPQAPQTSAPATEPAKQETTKPSEPAATPDKPADKPAAILEKPVAKEVLMAHGENKYFEICAMCHKANGEGLPPTFPSLAGSAIVTQAEHIGEHIRQLLYGKKAMPAFGQYLSDYDIAAIVTFERNAFGNKTGDVIQPSDVSKVRAQHM